jgi:hypothetical protein
MCKDHPLALALIGVLLFGLHCPLARCAEGWLGEWRVFLAEPAPWLAGAEAPSSALPMGARLRLQADSIDGPAPLACTQGRSEALMTPPEGLFQGQLDAPQRQALALGLAAGARPGLRIDCSSGSWDFHAADADTLLFALDGRLYSLSRAAGALAAADAPEAAVQALLERHFAGDRGFGIDAWSALREALSGDLWRAVEAYAAASWPADDVPPINGDPLTDSQEMPSRFAVGAARLEGLRADVPARFADAYGERAVVYRLLHEDGRWRVQDLRYADGRRLGELLAERPQ